MLWEIAWTVVAAATVGWTVLRLPAFWRCPRGVEVLWELSFRPENQARALPALSVLLTPLALAITVIAWVQPDDDPDGVAPWLQGVVIAYVLVSLTACLVVAASGRPRFAVPPSLRGPGRRAVALHFVNVQERAGDERPFLATCACGWQSDRHDTEAAARAEAGRHSDHVMRVLDRVGEPPPA